MHLLCRGIGGPVFVRGDANRLAQVVGNLLQNAAKFTERGGRTTLSLSADPFDGRAVLRVSDTGVGMRPEVLGRLFQPFMQSEASMDRSRGGLGLGLALVKGLVNLHGGEVSAASDGPGKGSEFAIRLPLDQDETITARSEHATPRSHARRALIIDDNVDAADSLREALAMNGHEVEVAYNGRDGLTKARQSHPEFVFCDIAMPGMDGYAVARALRAEEALRDTHLIALSGYALSDDLRRATDAGFERHLAKPPSLEAIEHILS